ncbi:MAG: tetratricopeptide repeat protein [Opitutales bacterium]|nr:tetratricopeptide repeat protein [Opitutales bacterium]
MSPFAANAQTLSEKGVSELRNEAFKHIENKDFLLARPILEELVRRFSEMEDKTILKDIYFFLGYSYITEYQNMTSATYLESAIPYFDKILQEYPGSDRATKSIELKANCLNGLGKFDEAAETWGLNLQSPYVEKLNQTERYAILKRIAQAYYNMKNWEKGEEWFKKMLASPVANGEDKTYAAIALIRCYLASENFDEAKKYFSYLTSKTPARYDIALSADFMTAGDKLAAEEKYALASLCYTFVLTRDEILDYMKDYKAKIERKIASLKNMNTKHPDLPALEQRLKFANAQIKGLSTVSDYRSQFLARKARNFFQTKRRYESFWAYRQLIDAYPDDKMVDDFYYAAFVCARQTGKESQIDSLGNEYREKSKEEKLTGKYLKEINLQYALFLLDKADTDVEKRNKFFTIAQESLKEDPDGDTAGEYMFLMGREWLSKGEHTALRNYMSKFVKDNPDASSVDGALYWQMLSYLTKFEYAEAFKLGNQLVENYPDSIYHEDASFRRAIAVFGDGQISDAAKYFESFIENYEASGSKLIGEARLFLGDIAFMEQDYKKSYEEYMKVPDCAEVSQKTIDAAFFQCAGMLEAAENFEKQSEVLLKYLKDYPEGNLPMAYYLLSQPLFKQGRSADAVIGYMDSVKKFGGDYKNDSIDKILAAYPDFYKEAKVQLNATTDFLQKLATDRKFFEMFVEDPAARYQYTLEYPDVNPLVYAKFKIKMGEKKAEFGKEVLVENKPILELLNLYKSQKAKFPNIEPEQFFSSQLEEAKKKGDKVLQHRMEMALDEIGKLKERPQMFGEEDFKNMPYKVVIWMGKCNEKYSLDSARNALQFVIDSDSDYRLDALLALADLEARHSNYEVANSLYEKVEKEFALDPKAVYAAIKQGEMFWKMGKLDEARNKFGDIVRTTAWRGEPHAEALLRLGKIDEEQGKNDSAISYYVQCASGYASCIDPASEATLLGARLKMKMGDIDYAKTELLDPFLEEESNKDAKFYKQIEELRNSIN